MTRKVDEFLQSTNKYTDEITKLMSMFETIQSRISSVNEIESKAEEQISRLDEILEEKKRNYDLKDLKNSLDKYNANLQSVSEFVNKDVAENIVENTKTIQEIKSGNIDLSTVRNINTAAYKDYEIRIRSMACIDTIIKNCEYLWYPSGKIPGSDIEVKYLLLKGLDEKNLHLGIDTYIGNI